MKGFSVCYVPNLQNEPNDVYTRTSKSQASQTFHVSLKQTDKKNEYIGQMLFYYFEDILNLFSFFEDIRNQL